MNKQLQLSYANGHAKDRLVVDLSYQTPLTENVENLPEIAMQRMELVWKNINDAFINKRNYEQLPEWVDAYLLLAARLKVIADQRLLDVAADKIKYAAHPTFHP